MAQAHTYLWWESQWPVCEGSQQTWQVLVCSVLHTLSSWQWPGMQQAEQGQSRTGVSRSKSAPPVAALSDQYNFFWRSICIQHRQKEQKIKAYYVAFRLPKLEGKGEMVISLCFSLLCLPRSFFAFSSSPLCVSKLVRCAFSESEKEREERKRERERRCVEEVKFGVRVRRLRLIRHSLTFQVSMKLPSADSLWRCSNEAVSWTLRCFFCPSSSSFLSSSLSNAFPFKWGSSNPLSAPVTMDSSPPRRPNTLSLFRFFL